MQYELVAYNTPFKHHQNYSIEEWLTNAITSEELAGRINMALDFSWNYQSYKKPWRISK